METLGIFFESRNSECSWVTLKNSADGTSTVCSSKNTETDHVVISLNLLFTFSTKYNVFPKTRWQRFKKVYIISFDFMRSILVAQKSIVSVEVYVIAIVFTICTHSQPATHTSERRNYLMEIMKNFPLLKGTIKGLWGIPSLELQLVKWFHQGLSSAIWYFNGYSWWP